MKRIFRGLLPLLFWLGIWWLAALFVGKELLLPGPVAVLARLCALATTPLFWATAGMSLLRIFVGFLLGALAGTMLAGLTAALPWARLLLAPAIRTLRATPVASFILLLLLWAEKGQVPALTAGLMVLPVVWENVARGLKETDPGLLELARAYCFGPAKTWRLVYGPSALPYLVSGCRTGLGLAWKAGVAAEVLCVPALAIGAQIYDAKLYLETPDLFAWTVAVILLSMALERGVGWALGRAV